MAKNRANGEGAITHDLKRDYWQGKLVLPNGKRKSVYGKTRKEVTAKLAQLRREVDAGMHGSTSGEQTFLTFAASWLEHHRPSMRPKTARNYRWALGHCDGIGQVPLTKLTPLAIQNHYTRKLATLSSTSVHHIHEFVHVVLENAVKLEILPRNPSDKADAPPIKTKEFAPLSQTQTQALIVALVGDMYEPVIVLAISTGMREAELLGLRWKDIDWERRLVRVETTLHRIAGNYELGMAKSRAGRRKIPLPDYATSVLVAWKRRQEEERDRMGLAWGDTWDLVFTTPAGLPIHYSSLLHHFQRLMKASGLPEKTRIHDLRHTFATLLLERGVHIKAVSELLGHASVEITLRVYGHVTPRMQDTAVMEINNLLPVPSIAEAVAGEVAAEQHAADAVWADLASVLDNVEERLRGEMTLEDWQAWDAAQERIADLQRIGDEQDARDTTAEDIDDEEGEEQEGAADERRS